MPIKAVLGNSSISVNDFLGLQVGDIIRLDTKVDQELSVFVGSIKNLLLCREKPVMTMQ